MKEVALHHSQNNASSGSTTYFIDIIGRYLLPLVLIGLAVVMKLGEPTVAGSVALIVSAAAISAISVAVWFRKAFTK